MSRISPATMTAFIFAILVGLAGAYSVRMYLSNVEPVVEQEEPPAPQMVFVPVAAREMTVGQSVSISDIVVQKYTQEEFEKSIYADRLFMTDTTQISGRQLQKAVNKGDEFAPDTFFAAGMGPSVTSLLKPGFRAVTIPIRNVGAVEGFASPSAMVDVLFRSTPNGERPEVTLTLLEKVEVLAVDRNVLPGQLPGAGSGRPATVTLAVTPEQAKALKAVEDRGELSLTLRHPEDSESVVSAGLKSDDKVTMDQIVGAPPKRRTSSIEIYYGGARQEYTFNNTVRETKSNIDSIKTPIRPETSVAVISITDTPTPESVSDDEAVIKQEEQPTEEQQPASEAQEEEQSTDTVPEPADSVVVPDTPVPAAEETEE